MRCCVKSLNEKKRRETIKRSCRRRIKKFDKKFGEALTWHRPVIICVFPPWPHPRYFPGLVLSGGSAGNHCHPHVAAEIASTPTRYASSHWGNRGTTHGACSASSRPPTPALAPSTSPPIQHRFDAPSAPPPAP